MNLKIYESTLHHNINQSFKAPHAYTFFQISIIFCGLDCDK